MNATITSVTAASSYAARMAITADADARQETAITSVLSSGFDFDWPMLLADDVAKASAPLESIERAIRDELRSDQFRETVAALGMNGSLIAAHAQVRHDVLAGIKRPAPILTFAEPPALATPPDVIAYWTKVLKLTDEQAVELAAQIAKFEAQAAAMVERISRAVMERVIELHARIITGSVSIEDGASLLDFIKEARTTLPDVARSILETEYRTRLTTEYGSARHQQIVARSNTFPFAQFMIIKDGRTTWWICLPMGTAGPNGRGYVAATTDSVWFVWRPPNHWRCRSDISPISYREAIRMGILAADGQTKIALIGGNPDRPFGDPPKFARHPDTGELRAVEPQEGFGG